MRNPVVPAQRGHRPLIAGALLAAALVLISSNSHAGETIDVVGNRRIDTETVRSYFHPSPDGHYDAAALDGAGRIRRVFTIDLPLMSSQLGLLSFLAVISTLQYGMAAFILTGGGPDNSTQVPILRMLSAAWNLPLLWVSGGVLA